MIAGAYDCETGIVTSSDLPDPKVIELPDLRGAGTSIEERLAIVEAAIQLPDGIPVAFKLAADARALVKSVAGEENTAAVKVG